MVVQDTGTLGLAAFRALFTHSSEGVLFCTQDGRITTANPAACAMLDMSVEEICGLGRDGLVDQEDPRWRIAVAERERTGSAVGVARLRRGDGRFTEIEMSVLEFRDDDAAPQLCCIMHDLTGRMAVERELEELSARLLQLSRGDELTGFQNRRGLLAAGTRLLQFADRSGAPVHALFVDVSNVQELNERHGHQAGDAALQAVARALSVTFRKSDVLAARRRDPIPGPDPPPGPVRLRHRHQPHPRPPRRARDDGVRRRPRRGLLRLDDPARRRPHVAGGIGGPLRLGHVGVPGRPPGRQRVVRNPGQLRLRTPYRAIRTSPRAPDRPVNRGVATSATSRVPYS